MIKIILSRGLFDACHLTAPADRRVYGGTRERKGNLVVYEVGKVGKSDDLLYFVLHVVS